MAPQQHDKHENGWEEYEKLILGELSRLNATIEALRNDIAAFKVQQAVTIGKMYTEIAELKVKSSIYGALSGVVTAVAMILVYYLRSAR